MVEDKRKKSFEQEVLIDEGVEIKQEGNTLIFKGPKGENKRELFSPSVTLTMKEGKIKLVPKNKGTKRDWKMIKTFSAHIKNLMKGVKEGHVYKLKICSGHFPMNASISGNKFIVKNFIGEKVPRETDIIKDVSVKLESNEIIVESFDKEKAGIMASRIEELTKRPGFDSRIFQDGIYITEKDGKKI